MTAAIKFSNFYCKKYISELKTASSECNAIVRMGKVENVVNDHAFDTVTYFIDSYVERIFPSLSLSRQMGVRKGEITRAGVGRDRRCAIVWSLHELWPTTCQC